ncbi:MAG TPA: hypothetical protein DHV22_04465 [Xanthomarina gelatinilytica]|uniref:Uncharacterized protein n=1 Tax=Xanthomarina gelatinilytica TaxID=1137281 RepID=A0A3D6BRQ5_9FLAO|nr:hypothetical protein [Xanthomarina gelatinilytica]|tara:strand:- start:630 stop:953 length:324 start_codon:yes stop_codon:yes gene_type:complete
MDMLNSMTFITPAGAIINTAENSSSSSDVGNARRVLVANGDNKKKKIFINDANGNNIASFILPRFNSITFIKKSTDKVYGQNVINTGAGFSDATNLTFQKVNTNHAD